MNLPEKPFYHFSVDDCFQSLIEVSDKNIPLFDHPFFKFLKELHDIYGTNIDLYLFYEVTTSGATRTLKDVSSGLKKYFEENPWIRFGPHALNDATRPHTQTPEEQTKTFDLIYQEIDRFAGRDKRSALVRLHYFSESVELAGYFKKNGVEAIFTTDKDAISYRLPEEIKKILEERGIAEYNGINFIRTNFRAEDFVDDNIKIPDLAKTISALVEKQGFVSILTHEYELLRDEVKEASMDFIHYASSKNIVSA